MDFALSGEQRLLQSTVARLFEGHGAGGADGDLLWQSLAEAGIPQLRVPGASGGSGLGLLDGLLVAEQAGRAGSGAPIADGLAGLALLARLDGERCRAAFRSATPVLLAPPSPEEPQRPLISAGVVSRPQLLLFRHGDAIFAGTLPPQASSSARFEAIRADLGTLGSTAQIGSGPAALSAFAAALEEWRLHAAASLIGAACRSLETAAAYARDRTAFGRPIGSYQGLAHPMADAITAVEGARLLLWRAAWEIAREQREAGATAALAAGWACRTARQATILAMRVFGGYGVAAGNMCARLYAFARPLAMRVGDPERLAAEAAERLWAGGGAALPDGGEMLLDFAGDEAAIALGEEARRFLARHWSPELAEFARESLDGHAPDFLRQLAAAALLYPEWPVEHGGRGASAEAQSEVRKAFNEVGWPMQPIGVTDLVGKMLIRFASEEVKREVLPRLARGEAFCCLGYTEPSCGSDIFAVRTRAVRDGEGWRIDGQKVFTTNGHFADYALLIARTDPALPKHEGVTLFLVPLRQPGYSADALPTIAHYRTNITHFAGVRVPDSYRVGEVNGGARTLAAALRLEQNAGDHLVSGLDRLLAAGLARAMQSGRSGETRFDSPDVRVRLAMLAARKKITEALSRRSIWAARAGVEDKSYGPMVKLFGSESWLEASQDLLDMFGVDALWGDAAPPDALDVESRRGILATIYGGTSEVQRSLIAEAALGLPRSRS